MTTAKKGFTIIEVVLFLGITGLMFLGLVISTRHNITGQRFSASVNDFDSFLRQVYNQVENVQIANRDNVLTFTSDNYCVIDGAVSVTVGPTGHTVTKTGSRITKLDKDGGRSGCSVYGKLVTFGEGLPSSNKNSKNIYVYDVIGDVVDARNTIVATNEKDSMREVHLGIVANRNGSRVVSSYSYTLDWGAWVETTTGSRMSGALLIVRSPFSGVIHTYYHAFTESQIDITGSNYTSTASSVTSNITNNDNISSDYVLTELDFCINSEDRGNSSKRRNIRLSRDARNASDIILIEQDKTGSDGNRC